MDEFSLVVVGIGHPNANGGNRRFEALLCRPGDPVALRREPRNVHDPRAVAVFSERGVQIGYLSAERAPWIGARLLAGEEVAAVFQEVQRHVAVIRVRFGGGAPVLPGPRPQVEPGPDWPPDPEWPD